MGVNEQDPGFFRFSGEWVLARRGRRALRSVLNYMRKRTERCLAIRTPLVDLQNYLARKADLAKAQAEVIHFTFRDRGSGLSSDELWDATDRANRRRDGAYKTHAGKLPRVGAFLTASFPYGVTLEEAKTALNRLLDFLESEFGVASEAYIHAKASGAPDHAHILMTDRWVDAGGIGKKLRALNGVAAKIEGRGIVDGDAVLAPSMEAMRSTWAKEVRAIAPAGARPIDSRSLARRGIALDPVTIFTHTEIRKQAAAGDEWWRRLRAQELAERDTSRNKPRGDVLQVVEKIQAPVMPIGAVPTHGLEALPPHREPKGPSMVCADAIIARLVSTTRRPHRRSSLAIASALALHARQRLKPKQKSSITSSGTLTRSAASVSPHEPVDTSRDYGDPRRERSHRNVIASAPRSDLERVRSDLHSLVRTHAVTLPRVDDQKPLARTPATIAVSVMLGLLGLWFRKLGADRAKASRRRPIGMMMLLADVRPLHGGSTQATALAMAAQTALQTKAAAASREHESNDSVHHVDSVAAEEVTRDTILMQPGRSPPVVPMARVAINPASAVQIMVLSEGKVADVVRAHGSIPSTLKTRSIPRGGHAPSSEVQARGRETTVFGSAQSSTTVPEEQILGQTSTTSAAAASGRDDANALSDQNASKQTICGSAGKPSSKQLHDASAGSLTSDTPSVLGSEARQQIGARRQGHLITRPSMSLSPTSGETIVDHQRPPERHDGHAAALNDTPSAPTHTSSLTPDAEGRNAASHGDAETVDAMAASLNSQAAGLPASLAFKFAAALYQDHKWRTEFGEMLAAVVGFDGDFDAQMQQAHKRLFRDASWQPTEVRRVVRDEAEKMHLTKLLESFHSIETKIRETHRKRKVRSSLCSPAIDEGSHRLTHKQSNAKKRSD